MGFFREWREKRKQRALERMDDYDKIERSLKKKLLDLTPGTEEYEKVQGELKANNIIREESRESKRRISKKDKGGMIIKCITGLIGLGGIGTMIWAERQDMTFTGEKRSIISSVSRGIGKIFFDFKNG